MLTQQRKRFQIQKLEERIAPSGCGCYHDRCCSGGDREYSFLSGNKILSGNDVDVAIGNGNFNGSFNGNHLDLFSPHNNDYGKGGHDGGYGGGYKKW